MGRRDGYRERDGWRGGELAGVEGEGRGGRENEESSRER